jgi:hypothetical protein
MALYKHTFRLLYNEKKEVSNIWIKTNVKTQYAALNALNEFVYNANDWELVKTQEIKPKKKR